MLVPKLAELASARAGRRDDADAEGVVLVDRQPGIVEGHGGSGHGEMREPIGRDEYALLDELRRVEPLDQARDAQRVLLAPLAVDRGEHRSALTRRLPEVVGADAVGRHHADPRDHRALAGS